MLLLEVGALLVIITNVMCDIHILIVFVLLSSFVFGTKKHETL